MDIPNRIPITRMVTSLSAPNSARALENVGSATKPVKRSVALVSLRFNPAFISLLAAFGKAFNALDFNVEFILDSPYRSFPEFEDVAHREVGRIDQIQYAHALFINVSVTNAEMAEHLKRCGTKILYVYHEPWSMSLDYMRNEGPRGTLMGLLAHRVSVPMLKMADRIILPSRYGARVYGEHDVRHNQRASYLPLLFDDENADPSSTDCSQKKYVSYIGGICQAHGFDEYIKFMRECFRRRLDLKFLIASKLRLPDYVLRDKIIGQNLDKLSVLCGRPLKNAEINRCYAESLCVWTMYRRSTQSAVLPKAFMFGAPVIANHRGAFPEFVRDGYNGRFADASDFCSLESGLSNIRTNIRDYATNCRNTFLQTFYYGSNLSQLEQLLAQQPY